MHRALFSHLALAVVTLAAIELLLQAVAALVPRAGLILSPGIPRAIPDGVLGRRPNPQVPDHDARGWRNPSALERAAVVALGDSQTYGDEVAWDGAWPLRLGEEVGAPAYNMALSGYGPVEYFLLGPEAMEKRPEVIVVGLYAGNDMADAFRRGIVEPLAPELVAEEAAHRDALLALDAERGQLGVAWREARASRRGAWKTFRDRHLLWLEHHGKLWGMVRGLERILTGGDLAARGNSTRIDFATYAEEIGDLPRDQYFPVPGPHAETVLTPAGRAEVMDRQDPRVAAGARIAIRALAGLRDGCGTDCSLVVVLIPTKELAFEDEVVASGVEPPASYLALLRAERDLWRFVEARIAEEGIEAVAVLEDLRRSIARGRNPYLSDWDGHPNVVGNEVIAEAVAGHAALRALAEGVAPDRRP